MKQIAIWASVIPLFLLLDTVNSNEEQLRNALLEFMFKLSDYNDIPDPTSGWNSSSYPCKDKWKGITCDDNQLHVKAIILNDFNFSGVLDAKLLCNIQSLSASLLVINITKNSILEENMDEIENCFKLTHVLLSSNQFSGNLPKSISKLKNLETLDISHNKFSGPLPDTLNLRVFLAQGNQFFGPIPRYNFSNFNQFDVSYNNLSGAIPDEANRFKTNSFIHNPLLCGPPLPKNCTSVSLAKESEPSPPPKPENNGTSNDQIIMFAGYILIAIAILFIILICLYKRGKKKQEILDSDNKVAAIDDSMINRSFSTVELKPSKNGYSTAESGLVSSSLIILTSPEVNGLRFEDLLKAPADLLGRGKHGSVYKVVCEDLGMILAVKRIKDWTISSDEFRQRMRRLNQVKHLHVLPAIAFYSSRQEKLLVYEYQQNGSLFRLIHAHGNQTSQPFSWTSRLSLATTIANALVFMHEELQHDKIPHGNLKSSNILLNKNMEPCISEYGLMTADNQDSNQENHNSIFKTDVHAFGVILLELLTGRTVLNDGLDLASWVLAVVREEWTVEVFDKNLLREGASEERLVNLLQVAIKCVNESSEVRPNMKQVALAISAIRDDDERSIDVISDLSVTRSFVGVCIAGDLS